MSGYGRGLSWTPEEDEAVRMHYPLHGPNWDGWAALLPGRTPKAVTQRASVLGVPVLPEIRSLMSSKANSKRVGTWTDEELAAIREHYPAHGPSWDGWAEVLPRRSNGAIKGKAKELRLTRCCRQRDFTEAEQRRILKVLIKLAAAMDVEPNDVATEIVRLGKEYERRSRCQ